MSKKAATVGDIGTDHDGFPPTPIIEGSQDIIIDNKPAARVGDALAPHAKPGSPPHDRAITTGSNTVFFNYKAAALTGSEVGCGGVIIGGSSVIIGDQAPSGGGGAMAMRSAAFTPAEVVGDGNAAIAKSPQLPPYLTGNYPSLQTESSYPAYKNTRVFPDQQVRDLLQANNHDVMLLTLSETFAYLQSEGWKKTKEAWVEATKSPAGQVMVNYGVNGKDVVTTSMVISKLGSLGIKATVEINHLGNEIIKFTGWPNVRKILNAPRFRLDNPKVVDVGIGKYGLKNSIVSGARLTFYVAAAYRTVDFILNDETSLTKYIGSLATDVAKIGIASAASWGAGAIVAGATSFVLGPIVATVLVGFGVAIALNYYDNKFGITDKVVMYIERSQQEMIEKAREIENGFWDIGRMLVDGLLDTGRLVIESELKGYFKKSFSELTPRTFR